MPSSAIAWKSSCCTEHRNNTDIHVNKVSIENHSFPDELEQKGTQGRPELNGSLVWSANLLANNGTGYL